MARVSRRQFLDLTGALGLAACGGGGSGGSRRSDGTGGSAGSEGNERGEGGGAPGPATPSGGAFPVGIAGFDAPSLRAAAVQEAIELAGGLSWLKTGDTVLIKVAHNSPNPYPATSSPLACTTLVDMLLQAGAKRVYVADLMGIENTLVPGAWVLEDPFGSGFDPEKDGTLRAFEASGMQQAVVDAVGASNVGPNRPVRLTSFREHGWERYESAGDTQGTPYLVADWVRAQVEQGERWDGKPIDWKYVPRIFDAAVEVPGMYVPKLLGEVDHIVNLHRISTHVMSHYTLALKNWVGIMRPDDRIWMHQLSYLLNHHGTGDDPIRSEPPYNELLPELHLSTVARERLMLADASEVIASGGPDESDQDLYPAQLVVAAGDLVSAEVVGLSIVRMAVLAAKLAGGLGGQCQPPPQSFGMLSLGFLGLIPWHEGALYGTDQKFCDPSFSHWNWIAVRRARELGMGAGGPADLDLRFGTGVPAEQRQWIEHDAFAPA